MPEGDEGGAVTGRELVQGLREGTSSRPPFVPILARLAQVLGQVPPEAFATDPQAQARALATTAAALHADAVTVGVGVEPEIGCAVVARLRPLSDGRAVVACLDRPDVVGVRSYCEAGVDMVLLIRPDRSAPARWRTVANACTFYGLPAILVDPQAPDAAVLAAQLGLHGAVVAHPRSADPGILGGGLSTEDLARPPSPPPRSDRFFWSFPDEVPDSASPELLARLGSTLTG